MPKYKQMLSILARGAALHEQMAIPIDINGGKE